MITEDVFGTLPEIGEVHRFTITNRFGEALELLDYGASVHSLRLRRKLETAGEAEGPMPETEADTEGRTPETEAGMEGPTPETEAGMEEPTPGGGSDDAGFDDVVLGGPDADSLTGFFYEGITIGRVANRIKDGRCSVFGKPLQLERNWQGNFMHGASGNYAEKHFEASYVPSGDSVTFRLHDDGAGGFGNEAEAAVTFTWDDMRWMTIRYEMTALGDTILCPTNHTYWDLSGTGDLRGQSLQVNAEEYAVKDETGVPNGERRPVAGTIYDLRTLRRLGEVLTPESVIAAEGASPLQIDDTFLLKEGADFAAQLFCPAKGRRLRVRTDMPAVVVFTPYAKQPRDGKNGRQYTGYCGVALETQFVPNAVNLPQFRQPVFRAGETLRTETIFEFSEI